VYYGEKKKKLASDFPYLSLHIPVFSRRAVLALDNILYKHGEVLPLFRREDEYYAFNVTRVLNLLNEDKSNLVLFSDGTILDIKSYSFNFFDLTGYPIFKLPQSLLKDVFVTEEFKRRVEESKLTGFTFMFVGNVLS
jgi:hypothetical protein